MCAFRRSLVRDRSGAAAVEFALVSPLLLLFLLGVVQYGFVFFFQTDMLQAAQMGARGLSIGTIETAAEAKTYVADQAMRDPEYYTVDVVDTGQAFVVTVTMPTENFVVFNPFGVFALEQLSVRAAARKQS